MYRVYLVLFLMLAVAQAQDFERGAMLESLTTNVILPAHERLLATSESFEQAAHSFAENPSPETLDAVQTAWSEAGTAWAGIELYALGPLDIMVLHNQINKPAINTGFIEDYLASGEVNAETLTKQGSTVKGLTAAEYILFDPEGDGVVLSGFEDGERLEYLLALSETLHVSAQDLYMYWSPEGENYAATFAAAAEAGGSTKSSINMLVNEMIVVLEEVARLKLATPLGLTEGGEADSEKAEAYRSETSLERIRANVESVENAFMGADGLGLDDYLVFLDAEAQANLVKENMTAVLESLNKVEVSLETALSEQPEILTEIYDAVKALLVVTSVDAANQLGITVTFSDADGD